MSNIHLQIVQDWRNNWTSVTSAELKDNAESAFIEYIEDRGNEELRIIADATKAAYIASISDIEYYVKYSDNTFINAKKTVNIDPEYSFMLHNSSIRGKAQVSFINQINNQWQ